MSLRRRRDGRRGSKGVSFRCWLVSGGRGLHWFVADGRRWLRGSGFKLRVTTVCRRSRVDGGRGLERAPNATVKRVGSREARAVKVTFAIDAECKAWIVAHGAFGTNRAHS